jgi:putative transposase
LSEEDREVALTRFRLLEPHLQNGRELRSVATGAGVSFRTLQRWVAAYRRSGLTALVRKSRADRGERRVISPRLREAVEGLALESPFPRLSTAETRARFSGRGINRRIDTLLAG